ncbi:hypothetical protein PPTG_02093 [Phytophthora nicotianae INRA-310]|uniref:Uncharacterized protein n=1 Tax=Phytophthora nicotianae (strain INRA-310) TaxID=761204 RepID=W2R9H2_PHYN3|nr:hypothetical protein PPTG_02093 [Phytophthora nicotianae INRA-310]ETN22042.1 hypothetical protein PPTG_02093 [Phytophthora nicotianae INRA-310]
MELQGRLELRLQLEQPEAPVPRAQPGLEPQGLEPPAPEPQEVQVRRIGVIFARIERAICWAYTS